MDTAIDVMTRCTRPYCGGWMYKELNRCICINCGRSTEIELEGHSADMEELIGTFLQTNTCRRVKFVA